MRVISRIFVSGGAVSASSTTTPTIDFLRKGTSTRLPGCTVPCNDSGTAYVNVVRSGTGSATLQNGGVIPPCSVSVRGECAGKRGAKCARSFKKLSADQKNSQENSYDSQPLPARNVLSQEESRQPDSDRSVQRAKDADHSDLLHFHSKIAEDKRAGIEDAHAQDHPAHFAARKTHGLPGKEDRRRSEQ